MKTVFCLFKLGSVNVDWESVPFNIKEGDFLFFKDLKLTENGFLYNKNSSYTNITLLQSLSSSWCRECVLGNQQQFCFNATIQDCFPNQNGLLFIRNFIFIFDVPCAVSIPLTYFDWEEMEGSSIDCQHCQESFILTLDTFKVEYNYSVRFNDSNQRWLVRSDCFKVKLD